MNDTVLLIANLLTMIGLGVTAYYLSIIRKRSLDLTIEVITLGYQVDFFRNATSKYGNGWGLAPPPLTDDEFRARYRARLRGEHFDALSFYNSIPASNASTPAKDSAVIARLKGDRS